ncbi:prephenate dehydratase [Haloarchaeobius sp. TZWWS8]|uniref:prephenate dehydratase n=1 Tax=Haloarchaeobius sp. TZWWS8 TaxID=3446121 RepID=UPI003EC032E3
MTVVTLGPAGTYSHRAASAVADGDEVSFRESVTSIVETIAEGGAERGVVPIENSIEGSVSETLDALASYDVAVCQEVVTPIRHALLAQDETFETVASHPQALAQCREYLDREYPDVAREPVASTAQGVERAREDPSVAAIAHPGTADETVAVLASDIQDRNSNATRFFVVAAPDARSEAGGKTSLVVYPDTNYPGLLLRLLEPFAERDINLSRVESRPSGERLGDYVFHIDIESGLYEERTKEAIAALEETVPEGWVRVLGSYDVRHVLE